MHKIEIFLHHFVCFTRNNFIRSNLISNSIEHISHVECINNCHREVQIHFQASFHFNLIQASCLLKENYSKSIKTRITKSEPVFRFIHPKAAWTARTGRDEYMLINNFFSAHSFIFQTLEVLDQVANRKVGWITLSIVPVFLTQLERFNIWGRDCSGFITKTFKGTFDQVFMAPGQSAK